MATRDPALKGRNMAGDPDGFRGYAIGPPFQGGVFLGVISQGWRPGLPAFAPAGLRSAPAPVSARPHKNLNHTLSKTSGLSFARVDV